MVDIMPIYEYECQDCEHRLEVIQKFSDTPLVECPSCGENTLKKLVSAAAFKLKGSGWYETDFKNNSKSNCGAESGKSKDSGASSKGSTACDSCPCSS